MGILGTILGTVGTVFTGNPAFMSIGSSFDAASNAKKASGQAGDAQFAAAQLGIDEQRRQFDAVQALLKPYVTAGTGALSGQLDLLGRNGSDAQDAAIKALQESPQFTALTQQGEDALLQNASATGGLRGGNVQAALAQFRPAILSQLIDQQYGRLGNLSVMGQNAAAGVGTSGMNTGIGVSNLLGQQGAARAGQALATGRADNSVINGINGAFGQYAGLGGFGGARGGTGINLGGGGIGGFSLSDLLNGTGLGGGL